ncbi:hypothetical protein [Halomontanus rarus]|uniref:hypothetical protein n=1 Tax=Halomontanus rarus TaxID=3034020 RepID=UPI00293C07B3|nr:hypothetical protein [Halovivax sp. KZCA124]
MSNLSDSLEELRHDREGLRDWWREHQDKLSKSELDDLFDDLVENKFVYLPIIIRITLQTDDTADGFASNLERLAPHINMDLAWGDFYAAFNERLEGETHFARELYDRLLSESDEWPKQFIGPIMNQLPDDELVDEILTHLQSQDPDRVDIAARGIGEGFRGRNVPDEIIKELDSLAVDDRFHEHIIRANASVFKQNPKIWDLTVEIGLENPELIQGIINTVGNQFEPDHLLEYLELLERGVEKGTIDDLQIHNLYFNAPNETFLLADFAVTLSEEEHLAASELAEQTYDENPDILPALFHRLDDFPSDFLGTHIVLDAGKNAPEELVQLIIDNFDGTKKTALLNLLQKSVGELFFSETYHQDTALRIADFIENLNDSAFVRSIRHDLIQTSPSNEEEKNHNKEVFYHLYEILSDILMNREFGYQTLAKLDQYPNLRDHFKTPLSKKIEQETFHPMLGLLQNDRSTHLEFLEDQWENIPERKRQQLLGDAFQPTLSEIGFLLRLHEQGLSYDVDVNIHDHQSGEPLEKDVDIVVEGNYIEIQTPQTWRNLKVANKVVGVPNTAYNKIASKFKSDYAGSAELTDEPVFIALDISRSEIDQEQVIASLFGSLKIKMTYNKETGEIVDERPVRDPDKSLKGWPLLDHNLNGVIWYTANIREDKQGNPIIDMDGDIVPNPNHRDDDNFDYCEKLNERIFGNS